MSQKLPVINFKWVQNLERFNESPLKTIMKIPTKDIFLKLMLTVLNICISNTVIYHLYLKN